MNRNEVIQIMCDVVNRLNFDIAQSQGANMDEARMAIEQHQPHLMHVNNLILDELISKGLVNVN